MPSKKTSRLQSLFLVLRNKYVITGIGFLVWMTFFDKNDFITTLSYKNKLDQLREQQSYYENEISRNKSYMSQLHEDPADLERFAREKYLMKKENEDIFVVLEAKD